jgi:uncharacterized protein YbcC (UPF0753/DUF2309 family)
MLVAPPTGSANRELRFDAIERAIEHAAHLLPAQGPITAFVHHNTLHALEALPFDEAVSKGAEIFGCQPYLSEHEYRSYLSTGRIRHEDLEVALQEDLGERAYELLGFLGTRYHLQLSMLAHPLFAGPVAEVRWAMAEADSLRRFLPETSAELRERAVFETRHWVMRDLSTGAALLRGLQRAQEHFRSYEQRVDQTAINEWSRETWEACCLHLLWLVCRDGVQNAAPIRGAGRQVTRHRDVLLACTGQDSDKLVHVVLIRLCAAFLDQGFSGWPVEKGAGLFRTFISMYRLPWGPPDRWLRDLPRELQRISDQALTPLESIQESLTMLGIRETEQDEFVTQTLLALRGFAGMLWQLECRADRVAHPVPPQTLVEFLAVRLILERFAVGHIARAVPNFRGDLARLRDVLANSKTKPVNATIDQRAFLVFQLAQLLGWTPESLYRLTRREWRQVISEIDGFSPLDRRRVYHAAFERQYRVQALDAVINHCGRLHDDAFASSPAEKPLPKFQLVTCIDEREESFRRHLEEIAPECETFAAAGFFAVAMYYRGVADAHFTPLCPVIIQPDHFVTEDVAYTHKKLAHHRTRRRRAIGTVTHRVHIGSRTFAGGWLAAVLGSVASIPLVLRILFPRATANLRRVLGGVVRPPAVTQLQLERTYEDPGSQNGHVGYNVAEMTSIVERLLQDIGMTSRFARLVIICGHGSSSMNNPHEAAHDCGACGGGRGGPNARAWAQMANDPRVRQALAVRGVVPPEDTVFLGAYHNTCDDSVTYYDLDRLPASHEADFETAQTALDAARKRSAHERCRRFESADPGMSPEAALRHVEGRAEDLSQVRPEYGHATNALCFVGRRDWSRSLFLDRRAFLQSYHPQQDDAAHSILERVLAAVIPVCAGINLEYYFSRVDPTGYGCGTKLPHNITALLGVMDGAASDLRPGLPWQMVEIHEPVRLLFVIETSPATMRFIMEKNESIGQLVRGGWVQVATLDPDSAHVHLFRHGQFVPYRASTSELPEVASSVDWYRGWRDHLGFCSIRPESDHKELT